MPGGAASGGAARTCRGCIPMTEDLAAAAIGDPAGHARYAIIRCLHGPRPEHRARRLVVSILAGAGTVARLPDVELAVHELVANARLHAPGPYELRILLGRGSVKIAVMDGGGDHAELGTRGCCVRPAEDSAGGESGRGLQIVTGLFPGSCGVEPTATCTGMTPAKQVWIEIETSSPGTSRSHAISVETGDGSHTGIATRLGGRRQVEDRPFSSIQAWTSLSSQRRTRAWRTFGSGKLGRRESWSARVRDTPSMSATSLIPTSAMALEP